MIFVSLVWMFFFTLMKPFNTLTILGNIVPGQLDVWPQEPSSLFLVVLFPASSEVCSRNFQIVIWPIKVKKPYSETLYQIWSYWVSLCHNLTMIGIYVWILLLVYNHLTLYSRPIIYLVLYMLFITVCF